MGFLEARSASLQTESSLRTAHTTADFLAGLYLPPCAGLSCLQAPFLPAQREKPKSLWAATAVAERAERSEGCAPCPAGCGLRTACVQQPRREEAAPVAGLAPRVHLEDSR